MKKLIYYEWQRIWMGKLVKLSLIGCCLFIAFCVYSSISQVSATGTDGVTYSGLKGADILKETRPEQILDESRVKAIMTEYLEYTVDPETSTDMEKFQFLSEEAYLKYYLPNRELFTLISSIYTPFGENYNLKESFSKGIESSFYAEREKRVNEWLQTKENQGLLTKAEKNYWLDKDGQVSQYRYGYYKGWNNIFNSSSWVIIIMIVICVGIAPIFAGEYQTRSDSLLLTLKYGKNKLIVAKIISSLLFATIVFWGIVLSYSATYLLILGTEGGNLPLQLINTSYPISYNLTIKQAVFVFLFLMYIAILLMVCITLLMSSIFKSSYTVIIVDFLLIVVPSFLYSNMGGYLWQHILALFPSKITEFKFDDYITYSAGSIVLDRTVMIFISYVVLSVFFAWVSYIKFKRHEVNK